MTITCFDLMYLRRNLPDRYEEELSAVGESGAFDGLRWFGSMYDISWEDRFSDPTWPDYWQVAESCLVEPWERYQLRAQIVLGSEGMGMKGLESDDDWRAFVTRWAELARKHPEKIIAFQICNEGNRTALIRELAQMLQANCPCLVAADTPMSQQNSVDLYGNSGLNIASVEMDRDISGTGGWWEPPWKPWEGLISTDSFTGTMPDRFLDIEPRGPYSSQSSCFEVRDLGFQHWLSIVLGSAGSCWHDGVGMRHGGYWDTPPTFDQGRANEWGQYNTGNGIPAKYVETPHWEAILHAFRTMRDVLPVGVQNWTRWNGHWDSNPINTKPYRNPNPAFPGGYDNGPYDDGVLHKSVTASNGSDVCFAFLGLTKQLQGITGKHRMRLRQLDPRDFSIVLREFVTSPEEPFTIDPPIGAFQGELVEAVTLKMPTQQELDEDRRRRG